MGPRVTPSAVTFRLNDPDRRLAGVTLYQEIRRPRNGPPFRRTVDGAQWRLPFRRPDADRMEYLIEILHRDGGRELVCDPDNDRRAPGPFGDKSVVEWPEYEAPAWTLQEAGGEGTRAEIAITSSVLRSTLPVTVWTCPNYSPGDRLPLLIVHDGPEYDRYSNLTRFLSVAVGSGDLPPLRVAMLGPTNRDQIYSASAAYARALSHEILPVLGEVAPAPGGRDQRVGMGASLGALAMLHTHRTYPATFGALFLQSGSFFRQRFDRQESGFVRFSRISRFMGRVLSTDRWDLSVPVVMTCGTVEENLANNRATHRALVAQGYDARIATGRDGHTWTGWRDTLHPHLTGLLARMWG
jgi:enterochelin esterase family protein